MGYAVLFPFAASSLSNSPRPPACNPLVPTSCRPACPFCDTLLLAYFYWLAVVVLTWHLEQWTGAFAATVAQDVDALSQTDHMLIFLSPIGTSVPYNCMCGLCQITPFMACCSASGIQTLRRVTTGGRVT